MCHLISIKRRDRKLAFTEFKHFGRAGAMSVASQPPVPRSLLLQGKRFFFAVNDWFVFGGHFEIIFVFSRLEVAGVVFELPTKRIFVRHVLFEIQGKDHISI